MADKAHITIYDIAKEAGVSPSTVSRVVSGKTNVKNATRERVMELVNRTGFLPNASARSLSASRSMMLGMLCPDIRNPYYATLFAECENAAYDRGYALMMTNTQGILPRELNFIRKLCQQQVDAVLICGGMADWRPLPAEYETLLRSVARKTPVVTAGRMEPIPECRQVYIDHTAGMTLAVKHLMSLGHSRIAFLHGDRRAYQIQEKLAAYRAAMEAGGLAVRPEYIVEAREGESGVQRTFIGRNGMNRLLSLPEPPTAVIASSDEMAVDAAQAIQQLGYGVPGDFSILGFDDSDVGERNLPRISSIHYDYQDYARRLVDVAIAAVEGEPTAGESVVPCTLTIKESCRKIQD